MITRGDIIWLGVAAGTTGSLIGGMMLGIGMDLIVNGQPWGWLLLLPAAPAAALPGWLLARKLASQL
jgi:F0F1-type ATP synthase assembly protein I